MLHIDLFSGIGGFALATEMVWEDVEHIFCDNDDFCQLILKKHWPTSKIYGDINELIADTNNSRSGTPKYENHKNREEKNEGWEKQPQHRLGGQGSVASNTDSTRFQTEGTKQQATGFAGENPYILTGGFPCQPFSQAGRRKGTADDRYLWPQMFAVIRNTQPQWVIAENVGGLVTWNNGMVLEQVCTDLESEGYEVQPFIIPAVSVNAPHRRDRVWIVAHLNTDSGRPHEHLSVREGNSAGVEAASQHRNWNENWHEVATRLCGVFNGFSRELDAIRLKRYATLSDKINYQDLPCLWEAIRTEAFQWSSGRFNTVQHKDYLFTILWKLKAKSERQDDLPFESQEVQDAYLRNVWVEEKVGCSPRRWEYQEQYANEHKDALSQLSHEIALATEAEWKHYSQYRNPRLKALGNAIVPQVAAEIMRAINL